MPIYFYNVPEGTTIQSPEAIDVQLTGTRAELITMDLDTLALHLDADEFTGGKNNMAPKTNQLFLPKRIKLVNYCPANLCVEVYATEEQA